MSRPVLTLDLGSVTGFAVGCPGDEKAPLWGFWELGMADAYGHGRRLSCLANQVEGMIAVHQPRKIVFEAPLARIDRSSRLLFYLCGIVELIASEAGIPYYEANVMQVRSEVMGSGRPKSADPRDPKAPMVAWCRARGWQVTNHNAADALILLCFVGLTEKAGVVR